MPRLIPAVPRAVLLAAVLSAAAFTTAAPAMTLAQLASPTSDQGTTSDLDGTWAVDPGIGSYDYAAGDFSGSWVGYRVPEELVGVGGTEAVGRTPDVTASITLGGSTLTAAELTADLTTLRSDESMRDGQLGRQGIESDRFLTATFVLTEPIELEALPVEGEPISVTAVGDLTLHGVTQSVLIPMAAVRSGDVIGVAGSVTFAWADFEMEQPTSMRVVSLANDVTMEFQVFFRHQPATPGASPPSGRPTVAPLDG